MIDIWSIGCIFAEILLGKPLFPGRNVVHQLELITDLLGTPAAETIEKVCALPAVAMPSSPQPCVHQLELITGLLGTPDAETTEEVRAAAATCLACCGNPVQQVPGCPTSWRVVSPRSGTAPPQPHVQDWLHCSCCACVPIWHQLPCASRIHPRPRGCTGLGLQPPAPAASTSEVLRAGAQ